MAMPMLSSHVTCFTLTTLQYVGVSLLMEGRGGARVEDRLSYVMDVILVGGSEVEQVDVQVFPLHVIY